MTHHSGHHEECKKQNQPDPNQQFHILPIDGSTNSPHTDPRLTGEVPSQLTSGSGLKGDPAVFAQPGAAIPEPGKLEGLEVSSTEELDQRAQELNKPKENP